MRDRVQDLDGVYNARKEISYDGGRLVGDSEVVHGRGV